MAESSAILRQTTFLSLRRRLRHRSSRSVRISGRTPGRSRPHDSQATKRLRINLALFIALLCLAIIYFRLHLREWVTGVTLLGGTFTLWSLWKLLQTLLGQWTGLDSKTLTLRLLRRPRATEHLVFALAVLGILFAITSSIYIEYQAGPASEYTVEILRDGNSYLDPLEVSSADRVDGRPFFFTPPRELKLRIQKPAGFRSHTRLVRTWSPVRLLLPDDFKKKDLFVLRLVPGLSLRNLLPGPEDKPRVPYMLEVEIGDQRISHNDFRRGVVLLGAGLEDLKRIQGSHDRGAFMDFLTDYLTQAGISTDEQDPLRVGWRREPYYLGTAEAKGGQKIRLRVFELPSDGSRSPVACAEVSMDVMGPDQIQSLMLERGGCSSDDT